MQKNEPKDNCPPPSPLSRDISPNNNYIHEPNKVNNIDIYENLKVSIGITFNELESLSKETLIQLIQFINYSCNFNLKSIKYSNYCCNIFEIKENLNRDGYNIVISKNEFNELNSKFRNKNQDINENKIKINNENDDNLFLPKEINEEKHNYYLPISCLDHNNKKFNSLSTYLNHCKEDHKIFTCKGCGAVFEDFNNFKFHIYKVLKIENENRNIDIENNDTPPLFKYLMESNILENNIKCTKCELTFDSIEKFSIHFYEEHEKKITKISKINEEFQENKNQSKNKSFKECSGNKIEINKNGDRNENLNQKEDDNIKSKEVKKKSTFEGEEIIEIIEENNKENSTKKESKFLQRKKNHDKKGSNDEIFTKKEGLKRQEELKKQEEFEGLEEHKIQKQLKREEDLKEEEEIKNNLFYYVCCYDNKKFATQKLYFEHFTKEHSFICDICGKKFISINEFQSHYNSKNKNHNNFKCKVCGKAFLTNFALNCHCRDKKH